MTNRAVEYLRNLFKKMRGVPDVVVKRVDTPDNYTGFTAEDMAKLDIIYVDADGRILSKERQEELKGKGFIPQKYLDRQAARAKS